MYFKLAPGVRVRVTSHGVRTSVGPRAARVHVGGGYRAGVSTGAGPVTLYHSVGGTRRRRPRTASSGHGRSGSAASVAAYHRQAAAASKSSQAQELAAAIEALQSLHRHPVEPVSPPVAPEEPPVDADGIRRKHRDAATAGIAFWKRSERRNARDQADRAAESEIAQASADRDTRRRQAQTELDQRWQELLANDPDVVLATLAEAFEDQELHSAPVSVDGAEVSVAVFVPGEDIVPERKPTTTAAGNLSLQKMTKTEQADLYLTAVCGHVLAAVREAFAVAPRLDSARVAAVRAGSQDAYGHTQLECLLAVTLIRAGLEGVEWSTAPAAEIIQQAGSDLSTQVAGRTRHLEPLDLSAEPELSALLKAVDAEDQ